MAKSVQSKKSTDGGMSVLREESGLLAVEALIGFSIFIFAMLSMYSLIRLYSAQSRLAHALSQACQSMALESYRASGLSGDLTAATIWGSEETYKISDLIESTFLDKKTNDESRGTFVALADWTDSNDEAGRVAEARFYAYLGGTVDNGKTVAEALGVRNLNFDGTEIKDGNLTIRINYDLRLLFAFDRFGKTSYSASQSVTSRMWKK